MLLLFNKHPIKCCTYYTVPAPCWILILHSMWSIVTWWKHLYKYIDEDTLLHPVLLLFPLWPKAFLLDWHLVRPFECNSLSSLKNNRGLRLCNIPCCTAGSSNGKDFMADDGRTIAVVKIETWSTSVQDSVPLTCRRVKKASYTSSNKLNSWFQGGQMCVFMLFSPDSHPGPSDRLVRPDSPYSLLLSNLASM